MNFDKCPSECKEKGAGSQYRFSLASDYRIWRFLGNFSAARSKLFTYPGITHLTRVILRHEAGNKNL